MDTRNRGSNGALEGLYTSGRWLALLWWGAGSGSVLKWKVGSGSASKWKAESGSAIKRRGSAAKKLLINLICGFFLFLDGESREARRTGRPTTSGHDPWPSMRGHGQWDSSHRSELILVCQYIFFLLQSLAMLRHYLWWLYHLCKYIPAVRILLKWIFFFLNIMLWKNSYVRPDLTSHGLNSIFGNSLYFLLM